jgi:hypothetical protein
MSKSSKHKSEPAPHAEAEGMMGNSVAETAYYLAEKRGFEPGFEVDDWCAAEKISAGGEGPKS